MSSTFKAGGCVKMNYISTVRLGAFRSNLDILMAYPAIGVHCDGWIKPSADFGDSSTMNRRIYLAIKIDRVLEQRKNGVIVRHIHVLVDDILLLLCCF